MRYIRHLSQRPREQLGFRFPPRCREPVRYVSYCPCRVCGTSQSDQRNAKSKKAGQNCVSITDMGWTREEGNKVSVPSDGPVEEGVAHEEGPRQP